MGDDAILEAARSIRPHLAELDAEAIDGELAGLLAAGDEDGILALLEANEATAEWTAAFLAGALAGDERYAGLPGHGEPPPAARRYVCPEGDFVWWRRGAEPLRRCPTHPQLALAAEGG